MNTLFLTAVLSLATVAASAQSLVPGSDIFLEQTEAQAVHDTATDTHVGATPTATNLKHSASSYGFPAASSVSGTHGLVPGSRTDTRAVDTQAGLSVLQGTSHGEMAETALGKRSLVPGSGYGNR
ncbi:hypothetical protein [Aureimonas sp. N4]|uniref:hypothetical protein n=1 Tax=Aureimonas sp. N4 TaxID=1638165 RepID=UPI000785FB4E|nr:hypothetical protein [Aureimonas sp. N4]